VPRPVHSSPADVELLVDELSRQGAPDLLDERCGRAGIVTLAQRVGPSWHLFDQRPLADMLGWLAPPSCDALVVQVGTPHVHIIPLPGIELSAADRAAQGADGEEEPEDLWLTVAVDRSARWASRLDVDGRIHDQSPDGGRVPDVLLRCLGLPTDPPAESTAGILATLWLLGILTAATEADATLTWTAAVREHMIAAIVLQHEPGMSHRHLLELVQDAPQLMTWEVLKMAEGLGALCPPDVAGWMDSGVYSRWVTGQLPDVATLLPAARRALRPAAYRRVVEEIVRSMNEPWDDGPG
jgi:hypothetical protein